MAPDVILNNGKGERFVDIEKCHNMHPRLSKSYDYIKSGTAEDREDYLSFDILTNWKKAAQSLAKS